VTQEVEPVLILSRKRDQSILIPQHGIEIVVTEITRSRVAIGIRAPQGTAIIRQEIAERYGYHGDHAIGGGGDHGAATGAAGGQAPPAPGGDGPAV
jgi:carbon storage regulator CsrA